MMMMAMTMMMMPHSSSTFSSDAPSRCCTCYIARKVQGHCADLIVIVIIVIVNLIIIVIIVIIVFIVIVRNFLVKAMIEIMILLCRGPLVGKIG